MTVTPSASRFSDRALQCAEQRTVKCPSSFQFRTFVDVKSSFTTADELLHKFDVFRNSDVRTDRGRPLPFRRSVTPVKLLFFSSRSTLVLAQFFAENFPNKRCETQFFSWRKTLISVKSSRRLERGRELGSTLDLGSADPRSWTTLVQRALRLFPWLELICGAKHWSVVTERIRNFWDLRMICSWSAVFGQTGKTNRQAKNWPTTKHVLDSDQGDWEF